MLLIKHLEGLIDVIDVLNFSEPESSLLKLLLFLFFLLLLLLDLAHELEFPFHLQDGLVLPLGKHFLHPTRLRINDQIEFPLSERESLFDKLSLLLKRRNSEIG